MDSFDAGERVSHSAVETFDLGCDLGNRLQGGEVLALLGGLGAGKTQFVRGLAKGMGLDWSKVRSPSYVLIDEHPGEVMLYHVDLLRLRPEELSELGLEEICCSPGSVVAIEWSERLEEAGWDLQSFLVLELRFHPDDDDWRLIRVRKGGPGQVALNGEGGAGNRDSAAS